MALLLALPAASFQTQTTQSKQTTISKMQDDRAAVTAASFEKIFSGMIGGKNVEMRLVRDGENLSGSYAYAGNAGRLMLKGRIDAKGNLTLAEFDANNKQTGKFKGTLTASSEDDMFPNIQATWTRPDGGGKELSVSLTEQFIEFTNDARIVPKTIRDKRYGLIFNYPTLAGGNAASAAKFNRDVEALALKNIKDFTGGEPPEPHTYFETSYDVLLAGDDLISIGFGEDDFTGGAHPNGSHYGFNYDLRGGGRVLQLTDIFKPNSAYKKTITQYAVKILNEAMKKSQSEGQEQTASKDAAQTEETFFNEEEISEWTGWAITRQGFVVYLSLPHVIQALDTVIVPYSVLKNDIKPDSLPAKVAAANR